jgi:hypothetical protein
VKKKNILKKVRSLMDSPQLSLAFYLSPCFSLSFSLYLPPSLPPSLFLFIFIFSEIRPCYVTQAGLKLRILLTPPEKCWDYNMYHHAQSLDFSFVAILFH